MAGAPAPLEPGIYVVDGEAVGSLAPKFRGLSYAFMVTNAIGRGSDIQMWCADLVPAGKVPDGKELAGLDVWALHGHPFGNIFVVRGGVLLECDSNFNERYAWKHSEDFKGKLFREAAPPPVPAKNFPSENFVEAVVCKNPKLNEPYSPSTQTIVEACAFFSQPLSEDSRERQGQLVQLYTAETPLYHEMNQALRDDCLDKMRYFGAYIKELRDVFKTDHEDQIITPFEGTVWRGISLPDPEAALKLYAPGSIFVWPAFTSMSTEQGAAMGFGNLVFQIRCCPPPGHYEDDTPEYAPASVEEWSCFKGEHEILFPPNIKFKVEEIRMPDDENGLYSPLVVCETVGFDTDGGIVEFSKLKRKQDEGEREREEAGRLRELVDRQQQELAELRASLAACCERLGRCEAGVAEGLEASRGASAGLAAAASAQDLEGLRRALGGCAPLRDVAELRERLAGLAAAPSPEDLEGLRRALGGCAPLRDVAELRERLEREAAAHAAGDEARRREESRLRERCDSLQAKLLDLAGAASLERGAVQQRLERLQAEGAEGRAGLERELARVAQRLQGAVAEALKGQEGLERELSRLSARVQEQLCKDLRRTQDMDQVLKGLTDKCQMTNMILAMEKLKHETVEIKTLLASEPKRALSSSRRTAVPGNPRATLDAAVQGVSDIRSSLETLRMQFPKDMQAMALGSTMLPAADSSAGWLPLTPASHSQPGAEPVAAAAPQAVCAWAAAEQPVAAAGALQAAQVAATGAPQAACTWAAAEQHVAAGGALQAARAARKPAAATCAVPPAK